MATVTPTWRQQFIASHWLPRLWIIGVCLWFAVGTRHSIGPLRYAFNDIWSASVVLAALILSIIAGFLLAVFAGWVLFGSTLAEQGRRNGGPFQPGDLVQVLSGRHRNRVARVYSTWQCNTVRVDLGEDAKERFRDIFPAYQLLRVEPAEIG